MGCRHRRLVMALASVDRFVLYKINENGVRYFWETCFYFFDFLPLTIIHPILHWYFFCKWSKNFFFFFFFHNPKFLFTSFESILQITFIVQPRIITASWVAHLYVPEPVVCVAHRQQDDTEKVLVVAVIWGIVWFPDSNVFSIQGAETVVKVPPRGEPGRKQKKILNFFVFFFFEILQLVQF